MKRLQLIHLRKSSLSLAALCPYQPQLAGGLVRFVYLRSFTLLFVVGISSAIASGQAALDTLKSRLINQPITVRIQGLRCSRGFLFKNVDIRISDGVIQKRSVSTEAANDEVLNPGDKVRVTKVATSSDKNNDVLRLTIAAADGPTVPVAFILPKGSLATQDEMQLEQVVNAVFDLSTDGETRGGVMPAVPAPSAPVDQPMAAIPPPPPEEPSSATAAVSKNGSSGAITVPPAAPGLPPMHPAADGGDCWSGYYNKKFGFELAISRCASDTDPNHRVTVTENAHGIVFGLSDAGNKDEYRIYSKPANQSMNAAIKAQLVDALKEVGAKIGCRVTGPKVSDDDLAVYQIVATAAYQKRNPTPCGGLAMNDEDEFPVESLIIARPKESPTKFVVAVPDVSGSLSDFSTIHFVPDGQDNLSSEQVGSLPSRASNTSQATTANEAGPSKAQRACTLFGLSTGMSYNQVKARIAENPDNKIAKDGTERLMYLGPNSSNEKRPLLVTVLFNASDRVKEIHFQETNGTDDQDLINEATHAWGVGRAGGGSGLQRDFGGVETWGDRAGVHAEDQHEMYNTYRGCVCIRILDPVLISADKDKGGVSHGAPLQDLTVTSIALGSSYKAVVAQLKSQGFAVDQQIQFPWPVLTGVLLYKGQPPYSKIYFLEAVNDSVADVIHQMSFPLGRQPNMEQSVANLRNKYGRPYLETGPIDQNLNASTPWEFRWNYDPDHRAKGVMQTCHNGPEQAFTTPHATIKIAGQKDPECAVGAHAVLSANAQTGTLATLSVELFDYRQVNAVTGQKAQQEQDAQRRKAGEKAAPAPF